MSETMIQVSIEDLANMLALSRQYEAGDEPEQAQGALDEIRDTLRFILHDAGAVIDPGIAANDGD